VSVIKEIPLLGRVADTVVNLPLYTVDAELVPLATTLTSLTTGGAIITPLFIFILPRYSIISIITNIISNIICSTLKRVLQDSQILDSMKPSYMSTKGKHN
jgi:hypothetical protein